GSTAFNSFKYFDVNAGKTVNLHLPGGTQNLINLVNSRKTKIDGVLNGFQNGQIGGNVFFLNPYGIAIGASGVVNVGSFTAITPDKNFMKEFFTAPGNPSAGATAQVLAGTVPLNKFGAIVINGRINAERDVTLIAGDVTHAGHIYAGAAAQSSIAGFGDFVNIDGVEVGSDLVVDNGTVKIVAVDDVKITGQINVDGKEGLAGGSVAIDAGDAITVNKDALISAKGVGNNSDGGEIIILAQDDAILDDNALIDASAGLSGNGGFIEFSALDKIDLKGGTLMAAAANGLPGNILIDPSILTLLSITTLGGNFTAIADIINLNGIISTRQIAGTDHLNDASTGDSGSVGLLATQEINIQPGSQI
ncbi:MAG: leukotoxin LktA family filamentous adhesin, partial [Candidatus Omnitrophica bacterium]|nr:leukotoxin LktA family filamentous adhesin [Candidatus Omnitrophota bacterium]